MMSKRILMALVVATVALLSSAACHIYEGANAYYSNIRYTWDGKHLYSGAHTYYSNILYTFDAPVPAAILLLICL